MLASIVAFISTDFILVNNKKKKSDNKKNDAKKISFRNLLKFLSSDMLSIKAFASYFAQNQCF